ncbi:MAG TPA: heavy-metal-associated domain-containing protein, partial [Acidimicrobiales bacterium]|nr:heavy-metal-associated domain-containing protein [Acidimicrobiales bacterium]
MLLDILAPATRVVRQLVPRPRRRRWVGAGKAHIEVRGLHRHGLARDVEVALRGLSGVEWAAANVALGRAVVAFDGDRVGVEELVAAVEEVEGRHGAGRDPAPPTQRDHPGDRDSLRRHQTALVADLACLGLGSAGAILRLGPVPVELAGAVSLIENQPRLRRAVEDRLGPAADLALALVNASGQALSRGPLGLVVDSLSRVGLISEAAARNRAFDRLEETLAPPAAAGEAAGPSSPPRARPLPPGPVERYADRAGLASVGVLGLGLALTRSPRRTAALVLAGIPKPARLAREALAAQLGRFLADRGVTVLDPTALRRLDRLDTLVVEAALLANGGMELGT